MSPGEQEHPQLRTTGLMGLDKSYILSLITLLTRDRDVHFTGEESEAERGRGGIHPG